MLTFLLPPLASTTVLLFLLLLLLPVLCNYKAIILYNANTPLLYKYSVIAAYHYTI